jgi:histidinol-phosphate aminotransferase
MSSNVVELTSQRLRKLKLLIEHSQSHPIHYESPLFLEKNAVYKPLSSDLISVVIHSINDNLLHKYNEDYFKIFKDNLAGYLNIAGVHSNNLFVASNLYNFYEYLTELFLQKDQKILLYTSSEFSYDQEVKYLNSGKIVIDKFKTPVDYFANIHQELQNDDYKIVVLCANHFEEDDLKDFVDILPENIALVIRTSNPVACKYLDYGTKTVLVLREFPSIMTIVEPPLCFAIARKDIIDLLNVLQLPNHLNSVNLVIANYLTGLENPVDYDIKPARRSSEHYRDILLNLIRENVDQIPPKDHEHSMYAYAKRLRVPIDDLTDLSYGNHFLGFSEDLKKFFIGFLNTQEPSNYYSQRTLLRNMLAHQISGVHNKFHYNNIAIGAGVSGLLETITRAFVNDGEGYKKLYKDKVLLLQYSPDNYRRVVYKRDAIVEEVTLTPDLDVDLDELIEKINHIRPKLVIIDNPGIQTGNYLEQDHLTRLIEEVNDNTILVFDESLQSYAANENDDYMSALDFVKTHSNVIVLRSFSFLHALAGMRLGYVVGHEHLINCVDSVRQPFDVSPYAIYLGIRIIEENEIFEKVTLKFIHEQKEVLYKYFSEMGLFYIKSATNFVVFSTPLTTEDLQERLLPHKIVIKAINDRFVRVAVADQNTNLYLIKCLKMVLAGHLHH